MISTIPAYRLLKRLAAGALVTMVCACAGDRPSSPGVTGAVDRPSLSDLLAAWRKRPDDPDTAMAYASALRASGALSQAAGVLDGAVQANPSDGPLVLMLASVLVDAGRPALALEQLGRVTGLLAHDERFHMARGVALDRARRHREAQSAYGRALEIGGQKAGVLNNLALSFVLSGRLDAAEAHLREALMMKGDRQRSARTLALVLALSGDTAEAKRVAAAYLPEETIGPFRKALEAFTAGAGPKPQFPSVDLRITPTTDDSLNP